MKTGLLASAVVLGMALALPMGASAADTDSSSAATEADKSASVEVTHGELVIATDTQSGQLEAPSFQFGAKVSNVAQTGLKPTGYQKENTDGLDAADTYQGKKLGVDDETGSGAGWNVTAKLGAFTSTDTAKRTLDGTVLHIPSTALSDTTTTDTADLTAGATAGTVVYSAAAGKGMGSSEVDLSGATLDLPANTYAGHYVADLTYTLTSGPGTTSTTA